MKGVHKLEWSAVLTVIGVILLFLTSIAVTLIAPSFVDPSWREPSSGYQVQMYEVSDPNVYISTSNPGGEGREYVYHMKAGATFTGFEEGSYLRLVAAPDLEPYITRLGDKVKKLTSKVLLLRAPVDTDAFAAKQAALKLRSALKENQDSHLIEIFELFDPKKLEAFAVAETDGIVENWIENDFTLDGVKPIGRLSEGTIYLKNPKEYRVRVVERMGTPYSVYSEGGDAVPNLDALKAARFISRESLIRMGEDIYRIEGCWYCHTDQTRTLVQDVVLNGSASYPAPPSSANEYVYGRVTFPGTRRIGPDLSRVGIKRPHRDWHMSHFWSPKSESAGSVMPSFTHFFDNDPSGTLRSPYGVPNYKFEAIYQYLMTKGTRITPPTQAWWLGKDPMQTIHLIGSGHD